MNHLNQSIASLMVIVLVALAPCAVAQPADKSLAAQIDALVAKQGITDQTPGLALLIHQPGRFTFEGVYGLARIPSRVPITTKTMFELASVSKTFTATAVLILYDRGKLSLDDDVRKYLPELPQYNPDRPIQVRDLLQHSSGLPDYLGWNDLPAQARGFWVNEDYLPRFSRRKINLKFTPGYQFDYSNTNFMLLATIVQRIAKESFGTFMREEIFLPAGMKDTFVYENPLAVPAKPSTGAITAIGYEKSKKEWNPTWGTPPERHETELTVGDGAVWTDLQDMRQWDQAVRDGKFLKPTTWKLALTRSKTNDGKTNPYGLGWSLYGEPPALNGYGHDGAWGGFNTSYYRYLAADRTTVMLSNRGDFDVDMWYALNDLVEKYLARH